MKTISAGEISDSVDAVKAAEKALHETYWLPPSTETRKIQNDAWHALRIARERVVRPCDDGAQGVDAGEAANKITEGNR